MAKLKLTPKKCQRIVELIKQGNYASTAAQASGVSERSFWRYMERGEKLSDKCEAWEEAVDRWNAYSEAERAKHKDQEPNDDEAPTDEEIMLWQFWRDVKNSEAIAERDALEVIQQASDKNWQAAAWYLERKFKDRWGRQDKTIHEGSVAHNHQLLPTSPEAIEAGRQRLEEARKEQAKLEGAPEEPPEKVVDAEIVEE